VAGAQAAQDRADPREQVGHARKVGQDEVAVEAHHGDQLLHHLQLQREGGQQQQATARRDVGQHEAQHGEHVEVEAAQVDPDPPAAAEPVGVGDVGVEGREDDVDADADLTRVGTAVAAGRGVSHLVDHGRRDQQGVDEQCRRRRGEHLADRLPEAAAHDERDIGDDQCDEGSQDHRRPEQRREQ